MAPRGVSRTVWPRAALDNMPARGQMTGAAAAATPPPRSAAHGRHGPPRPRHGPATAHGPATPPPRPRRGPRPRRALTASHGPHVARLALPMATRPKASPMTAARALRRVPRGRRLRVRLLGAGRGDDGRPRCAGRLARAIRHITTRHEQGAAFMADVYGRLTGRCAVAMATLGPGRDEPHHRHRRRLPRPCPDGRAHRPGRARTSSTRRRTSSSTSCGCSDPSRSGTSGSSASTPSPRSCARRSASRSSRSPGPTHIELPENRAAMPPESGERLGPLQPRSAYFPEPTDEAIDHAAAPGRRRGAAARPGRQRRPAPRAPPTSCGRSRAGLHDPGRGHVHGQGRDRRPDAPVADGRRARRRATTSCPASTGPTSSSASATTWSSTRRTAGTRTARKRIIHIDTQPAEVDASYQPEVELIGDIDGSVAPAAGGGAAAGHRRPRRRRAARAARDPRPRRPAQRAPRRARARTRRTTAGRSSRRRRSSTCGARSAPEDIVVSDVGAHKIWVARLYQAYEPNTVIISQRLRGDGHQRCPGAIAAKLVHPDRQGRRPVRRRRLPDEQPGARDRASGSARTSRSSSGATTATGSSTGSSATSSGGRSASSSATPTSSPTPELWHRRLPAESSADLYPTLMRALETDGPSLVDVPIDYARTSA